MRKLKSSKLTNLKKLTEFRKTMCTAELGLAQARLKGNEIEIQQLNKSCPAGESVREIAAINLWQKWKNQELHRLTAVQAAMRVEYSQIENILSKAIAEDAIADHLSDLAKSEQKTRIRRQAEQETSHFLPDNVCDQDI